MAERQQPSPGEIVIMAAGGVMLIFSFLPFYKVSGFGFSKSYNSWATGAFPIATLLPLYGTVMGVLVALTKFANVKLPDQIVGFTLDQLYLALGAMAALMSIAWLITDTGDKGIGAWFEILGGIALVVGAVLLQREHATGAVG